MSNPPLKNALSHLYFRIYQEAIRQRIDCRGWYIPNTAYIAGDDNQRDNRITNVHAYCIQNRDDERLSDLWELCSLYYSVKNRKRPTITAWWSVGAQASAKNN